MQQNITTADLQTLSAAQSAYLRAWCAQHGYPELLSIGQMIHFITAHGDPIQVQRRPTFDHFEVRIGYRSDGWYERESGRGSPVEPLWLFVRAHLRALERKGALALPSDNASCSTDTQ